MLVDSFNGILERRQALELDVDLNKLKNVIQGVRSEASVA